MNWKFKSTFMIVVGLAMIITACASPTSEPSLLPTLAPTEQPTDIPTLAPSEPATSPTDSAVPFTDTPAATASVSFSRDIMPILQNRCFNCHGGREIKEGLSFESFVTLMAGSENGLVLIPGDAANSLLAQQLLNGKMPKKGPKLTPAQIQLIIEWINAGALNN